MEEKHPVRLGNSKQNCMNETNEFSLTDQLFQPAFRKRRFED